MESYLNRKPNGCNGFGIPSDAEKGTSCNTDTNRMHRKSI